MAMLDLRRWGQPILLKDDNIIIDTKDSENNKLTIMSLGIKFDIEFKTKAEMNEFIGGMVGHNNTF